MKSAYVSTPPDDCGSAAFVLVIGDQSEAGRLSTEPRLYLVASRLPEAIRGGVEQAVCDAVYDRSEASVEICDLISNSAKPHHK